MGAFQSFNIKRTAEASRTYIDLMRECAMKIGAIVLGALLTSVAAHSAAGTLTRTYCDERACNYEFRGPITALDVASFTAIRRIGDEYINIGIDSDGGDVKAAIKIGRHLQEVMATTSVLVGRCASACVIVLGASPIRLGFEVGIHRVYTSSSEGTFAERQSDFDRIGAEVKALFRRSGVRESL